MLELKGFGLRKLHLWQKVDFKFEPGITHVYGANRSGKTMLFRALSMILRAQVVKRGSSLSRLPKGASISLDFASSGEAWHANLTPSVLSLNAAGRDQGSTGKVASRALLASTLAIPVQLFDSTIHVQGTASHPLISPISTPKSRLEWVSSVLDLTEAYDTALAVVEEDIAEARTAETTIAVYEEELAEIVIPDRLPSLKTATRELETAREEYRVFDEGQRWLNILLEGEYEQPEWYSQRLERAKAKHKAHVTAHAAAIAYELETERAEMIRDLKAQLANIDEPDVPYNSLVLFVEVLGKLNESIETLHEQWADTAEDRRRSAALEAEVADLPANITDLIGAARAQQDFAEKQIRSLKHVKGSQCPVCSAKLSVDRKRELLEESETLLDSAQRRATELTAKSHKLNDANTLRYRLAHIKEPPPVSLSAVTQRFQSSAAGAFRARQLKQRLNDLKRAAGTNGEPPDRSAAEIEAALASIERTIETLTIDGAAAERWWRAHARATKVFGPTTDWAALAATGEALAARVEALVLRAAEVKNIRETAARDGERADRLEASIATHAAAVKHLPELLEAKEAMGRKGLRLTKVKELVTDFCAEFNSLIPLLWDEQFILEIEVKEGGLHVWATRNGVREDLDTLSGSETQGWKLITAFSLIRLLPDRLRANVIILDEIESFMDPETKERFVSNYLPELQRCVDSVILVSPVSFADSSLAAQRSYCVVKSGNVSRLQAA